MKKETYPRPWKMSVEKLEICEQEAKQVSAEIQRRSRRESRGKERLTPPLGMLAMKPRRKKSHC